MDFHLDMPFPIVLFPRSISLVHFVYLLRHSIPYRSPIPFLLHHNILDLIVDIESGLNHSIAFSKLNKLYSWGSNDSNQLGIDKNELSKSQTPIEINNNKYKNKNELFNSNEKIISISMYQYQYKYSN